VIRKLRDDTLIVFLSDCHIGGDEGRDIFESPTIWLHCSTLSATT